MLSPDNLGRPIISDIPEDEGWRLWQEQADPCWNRRADIQTSPRWDSKLRFYFQPLSFFFSILYVTMWVPFFFFFSESRTLWMPSRTELAWFFSPLQIQVLLSESAAFILFFFLAHAFAVERLFQNLHFWLPAACSSSHVRSHICLVCGAVVQGWTQIHAWSLNHPALKSIEFREELGMGFLCISFPLIASLRFIPPSSPFLLRVLRTIKQKSIRLLSSRPGSNIF